MTHRFVATLLSALLLGSAAPALPQTPSPRPAAAPPVSAPLSPGDIVAAAPAREWLPIAADDLLVITLAPDAGGRPRRIVIQLIAAPFSAGWVANIRRLAAAHWWDGTSINRVQDDYVVQWGDASEKKPLPDGLAVPTERDYQVSVTALLSALVRAREERARGAPSAPTRMTAGNAGDQAAIEEAGKRTVLAAIKALPKGAGRKPAAAEPLLRDWRDRDSYAARVEFAAGWPVALSDGNAWPVHCYGMVGVGRNLSPDTGTGAELYAVIGQAPRHLDRNIALVGRVIEGMAFLSSLPRGTGPLGFYETAAERVPILSVRLASALPMGDRPRFDYLSSEGPSFAYYLAARANRRDAFFVRPAGAIDICNAPVPIRVSAP